jgi:hypothetical protein
MNLPVLLILAFAVPLCCFDYRAPGTALYLSTDTAHCYHSYDACREAPQVKGRLRPIKWTMGRIGGNSGYSRSVEKSSTSEPPSKTKALARPGQKLSKWFKEQNTWMQHDVATRGPCSLLSVFDFDGTLFRSPVRHFPGGCSFTAGVGGLHPPLVPRQPLADWFSEPVLRAAQERIAAPNSRIVLLSGRPVDAGARIAEILASQVLAHQDRSKTRTKR